MTGIVHTSSSPQEFLPFEAPAFEEDKKRKTIDGELPSAKKVKQVIINSEPEVWKYTPELSQNPSKPLLQTAAQPRSGSMMPMQPPEEIIFPQFWTLAGRSIVPLGEGVWIGKKGRHGEELQLSLSPLIADEHCNLSWLEDKSKVIVQAKDYPKTTLGVTQTGGKQIGRQKVAIRVGHVATIRLGEMRIQFTVPQPSENEVAIQSYLVDKGILHADKLMELFKKFDRSLYLGRKPSDNHIILGHPTVSRRHGQLQLLENGSIQVTNLSTFNRLEVNGKKLKTDVSELVTPGKTLHLKIGVVMFFILIPELPGADDTLE